LKTAGNQRWFPELGFYLGMFSQDFDVCGVGVESDLYCVLEGFRELNFYLGTEAKNGWGNSCSKKDEKKGTH
jgi:hypothetical protein